MPARSRSLRTALLAGLLLLLLAALPAAASADAKIGGFLERGTFPGATGDNDIEVTLFNDGTEQYGLVVLELPPGSGAASEIEGRDKDFGEVRCTYDAFRNAIVCEFPTPLGPDDLVNLRFKTANRIPDDAGARAKACRPPCDSPSTDTDFFEIPGPFTSVDLETVKRIRPADEDKSRVPKPNETIAFGAGQVFLYTVTVTNNGLGRATNVVINDELPEGLKVLPQQGPFPFEGIGTCEQAGRVVTCRSRFVGPRVRGRQTATNPFSISIFVIAERTGTFRNTATATSDQADFNPTDNTSAPIDVTVTEMPDVEKIEAESTPEEPLVIEGTTQRFGFDPGEVSPDLSGQVMRSSAAHTSASVSDLSKLRRVEVAILRRGIKKGRCRWVKNKRGELKSVKAQNKKCSRGIWLRAKGVNRGKFALSRQLPPGSYTAYARAVNRGGVRETRFSRKDGNAVSFKFRRGRR